MQTTRLVQHLLAIFVSFAVPQVVMASQLAGVFSAGKDDQIAPVISTLAIQPGGALLAAGGDDHFVRLWDAKTHHASTTLRGHSDWVRAAAFTPDGNKLVTAGDDGRVIVWDLTQQMKKTHLLHLRKPIRSLKVSPDGKSVVAVGFKSGVHIVDIATGLDHREVQPHPQYLQDVAISPNGELLALGAVDGSIHLHRWSDGKHLQSLPAHRLRVHCLTFTKFGDRLVSTGDDRIVQIWNLETLRAERQIPTPGCKPVSVVTTETGHIIIGGTDNSIRIFDAQTGSYLGQLRGHTGTVAALATHGQHLFSSGYDTAIRHWVLDSHISKQPLLGGEARRPNNDKKR